MSRIDLPVVILAGGLGTRLREETEFRPKPMIPVGGRPLLWHIMKIYAHVGFYRFIICLGYKGEMIKDYFLNYRYHDVDVTVNTRSGSVIEHHLNPEEWEITLVDTGLECMTGGRIARVAKYIDTDRFLMTYGDGVADINALDLLAFHQAHGRYATVTGVNQPSRFGHMVFDEQYHVQAFKEKERIPDAWINGGFFVLERSALAYLSSHQDCVFEQEPMKYLARDGQLVMYRHHGFWQCVDTIREHQRLEELWRQGAPWKLWGEVKTFGPATRSEMSL